MSQKKNEFVKIKKQRVAVAMDALMVIYGTLEEVLTLDEAREIIDELRKKTIESFKKVEKDEQ